jgi:GH25 family lysozyme M1 (1,4-beta-N-acetylmuramidase)
MDKLRTVTILRAAAAGGVAVALSLNAVTGASAAVTDGGGTAVRGLDISAYQHAGSAIDWDLLPGQGIRFVAIKASEGTYYVNPYYPSDAHAAAAAGLAVLPYVFASPNRAGGAATADYAVRTIGSGRGRLPLVVDLENDPYNRHADCYGLHVPATIAWIAAFTARAKALTKRYPVIYTTTAWWRECTGSTGQFRRDPLWLAAFDGTRPTVPTAWRDWTFWQYNDQGNLAGISGADLDYYQPTSDLPTLRPAPAHKAPKPAHKAAKPAHKAANPAHKAAKKPAQKTVNPAHKAAKPAHKAAKKPAHKAANPAHKAAKKPAQKTVNPAHKAAKPEHKAAKQPAHKSGEPAHKAHQAAKRPVVKPAAKGHGSQTVPERAKLRQIRHGKPAPAPPKSTRHPS